MKTLSVSVIIATYNRGNDLLLTVPQVLKCLRDIDDVIIVDQTIEQTAEAKSMLENISDQANVKYVKTSPSLTVARNLGLILSDKDIALYIDDDVDITTSLCELHANNYEDDRVMAVAGRVALPNNNLWTPRLFLGEARALYGCHMSFRRQFLIDCGGFDIDFTDNFVGEEWEVLEKIIDKGGKVIDGVDCELYHRLQETGGCGNRQLDNVWYRNAYKNHLTWAKKRKGLKKITKLPKHIVSFSRSMARNNHPSIWKMDKKFINDVIKPAWRASSERANKAKYKPNPLVPSEQKVEVYKNSKWSEIEILLS